LVSHNFGQVNHIREFQEGEKERRKQNEEKKNKRWKEMDLCRYIVL
jgi:hypothetical protein